MITSKNVLGPQQDPTVTNFVYASLIDKQGKQVCVSIVHPEDRTSFEIQGKSFERTKERDEHSRVVFREATTAPRK